MTMQHVFFAPHVGEEYQSGGIFGKRIMVLGESHYETGLQEDEHLCEDEVYREFTKTILQGVINKEEHEYERWMPTYTRFERSLVNEETDAAQRKAIWNSLLFYNYLQEAVPRSDAQGSEEAYQRSEPAFFEVLEAYRPEYIIAWGYRLRDRLVRGERWIQHDDLEVNGELIQRGAFLLADNTPVKVMAVKHPSRAYVWKNWYPIIQTFLNS